MIKPPSIFLLALAWLLLAAGAPAASFVVAASNSTAEAKARADVACDGLHDEVELANSLGGGGYARSVEWLAGDYYLGQTLTLPATTDSMLYAEGTCLHYQPAAGDAVVIKGMMRSRYYLGTIETGAPGAALRLQNEPRVNLLMSVLRFGGLLGKGRGTGLFVDTSEEGIATNRVEGSEICCFETGVRLPDTLANKLDTNWFWLNSIHHCQTGIDEGHERVDDSVFRVGLALHAPGTVGLRTRGQFGRYDVTVSSSAATSSTVLQIGPTAWHNVFEVRPAIQLFSWSDKSGNDSNVVLSVLTPPWRASALSSTTLTSATGGQ